MTEDRFCAPTARMNANVATRSARRRAKWPLRWRSLIRFGVLLGRCGPPLLFVGVVAVMLHSEQAQELIRGMLEKQWESSWLPLELPLGDGIWVVLCAFAWGALVEVCARALIFSPYPRKPRVSVGVNAPYELVIRVVGFAGWASVMIPALNATQIPDIRSDVHVSLGPLLAFAMLSFFLLLLFFETALFAALCRVARWFPMLLRNPNFRAAMFPIPIRDPTFHRDRIEPR
jgi:hypothetical protein